MPCTLFEKTKDVDKLDLPCENGGNKPGQKANEGCPSLRADVTGLQRFTYSVVAFKADGQNGQNGSMCHGELHEWYCFA